MRKIENLIVGAGISGLSYARMCKQDYLIVEKEKEPGGLCRTFYQDDFIWDFAGHFFHFADPDLKRYFEEQLNYEDLIVCSKKTNIYYKGSMIDYPFQMNIHQLPKDEFIDCLYDLFHRYEKDSYDSFQEMLYGKFGQSITNKFLKPYNEKLYACDLDNLDTEAMGRFFPYADPIEIINNMKRSRVDTYNSTFDYPKRGAKVFVDALLKGIDLSKLLTGNILQRIDLDAGIAIVNGEEISYRKLINTMPLNHFIQLISDERYKEYKGAFTCNKVLVFNMGFDKPAIDQDTHWTYFPDQDLNFYRVGYYCNILNKGTLSIYVEIGFDEGDEIDIEKQLQLTLDNLKKCGIIDGHKLIAHNSLVIDPGYVHITKDSLSAVAVILKDLEKNNVYSIGRYGRWTYCSVEDCMVGGIRLAETIQ